MNQQAIITIRADQLNQLNQAITYINGLQSTAAKCATTVLKEIPETLQDPGRLQMVIVYNEVQALFEMVTAFGIILEKVNPQSL